MSVINKMLRDLDSRQSGTDTSGADAAARNSFTQDTQVINSFERQETGIGRKGKAVALVGLVLAGAAGAWWYQGHRLARLMPAVSSSVAVAPKSAASAAAGSSASEPARVSMPTAAPVVESAAASLPVAVELAAPAPARRPDLANTVASLRLDDTLERPPRLAASAKLPPPVTAPIARLMPAHVSSAAAFSAPKPARVPAGTQNPGAVEVLAQAQSLWNAGSHEAAIELLGQALALAERANAAGAPTGGAAIVAELARELARMEIAQGRVSQTLAMLTRLEPILADIADIWALRGNMAQRLGRHAESAAAYLMALKLKPNEPRWLLGAAVSLAAQGQTTAAAELAEKARSAGALSPEVASYLRQLGVSLR